METKESTKLIKKINPWHYSRFEKRDFPFIYAMILIPVVHFAVFWFYVNFSSITLAFQNRDGVFTLNNFKTVFSSFKGSDPFGFNLWSAIGRSMIIWVLGLAVFPIGILTTYVLCSKFPGQFVFRLCYVVPGLLGGVIWSMLIRFMLADDGIAVAAISGMGFKLPENALRNGLLGANETAFKSLLVLSFWDGIVGNSVVLSGAFTRVPDEVFESAKIDGSGFWRTCFKIAIPCIWPTIATLMVFKLCGIFTADCGVFLYSNGTGQPGMFNMGFLLYYIQVKISEAGGGSASYGYPAALGLFLTVITLPIALGGRKLLESAMEPVEY